MKKSRRSNNLNQTLRKRESDAQHIDDLGVKLLNNALPTSQKFKLKFIEQSRSDFGVDGYLQVFENGRYKNEDYKIQLKSTSNPKFINSGKTLSHSLDLSSIWSYVKDMKSPIALIVADTKNNKIYWGPIQTDSKIQTDLDKKIEATTDISKKQTMAIRIDVNNELKPDHYQELYDYFKQASLKLAKETILQTRVNQTLGTGMKILSEIEKPILELEGFTPYIRQQNERAKPGTIMTMNYGDDKAIDYVPSNEYRPELAPQIKLKAKFSLKTKEGEKRAEAFKNLLEKGEGAVELTDENIESFEAVSGQNVIDDKNYISGGVKLMLSPYLKKQRLKMFISIGKEELENIVDMWIEGEAIHIQSIEGQPLYVTTAFKVKNGVKTTFNVRINSNLLKSSSQELRLINFLRGVKQIDISLVDHEGFKRKLFGGTFDGNKMISDESYQFIKAITEIEQKSGVPVPYPLPDKIKKGDIKNVFWVHRLLTQEKITQDMTVSFTLQKKPPEQPRKGGVLRLSQSPPEIYLFGHPYVLTNFTQNITGTVTDIEKSKDNKIPSYKIRMKEAQIALERTPKD